MALLSDRNSFDRLTCQRIYFADAVGKLAARAADDTTRAAIERYAQWRAYDDATTLDSCFAGVPTDQWRRIIDAVNGLWDNSRP